MFGKVFCLGNTYLEDKSRHKYTRVARGQDEVEVKSMIHFVLVKKYMLQYIQDVRIAKGMERGLSDHHIILCKVRLRVTWIKKREVGNGDRRNRSEKLRKYQYIQGYAWSFESKRVEWDEGSNVENIKEQDRAGKVCWENVRRCWELEREVWKCVKGKREKGQKGYMRPERS